MSEGVRKTIKVPTTKGFTETEALCLDNLAVQKGVGPDLGHFRVCHIATGFALPPLFDSEDDGLNLAKQLDPLPDWKNVKRVGQGPNDIKISAQVKARLRKAYSEARSTA